VAVVTRADYTQMPVTRSYFIDFLKNILERIGYDCSKYNGHSFRIGAATSANSEKDGRSSNQNMRETVIRLLQT
jgi:hypothetical protein